MAEFLVLYFIDVCLSNIVLFIFFYVVLIFLLCFFLFHFFLFIIKYIKIYFYKYYKISIIDFLNKTLVRLSVFFNFLAILLIFLFFELSFGFFIETAIVVILLYAIMLFQVFFLIKTKVTKKIPTLELFDRIFYTNIVLMCFYFYLPAILQIQFLTSIKFSFFLFFVGSFYIGYKEIIVYIHYIYGAKVRKITMIKTCCGEIFRYSPLFAISLVLRILSMVIQIGYELVCLRYGVAGLLWMGGPGIIGAGGEDPDEKIDELMRNKQLREDLRNNSPIFEADYDPRDFMEDTLPDKPSTNHVKFTTDVANNTESFKQMHFMKYSDYVKQFKNLRENVEEFRLATPSTFEEFLSSMPQAIVGAFDENGNVKAPAHHVDVLQFDFEQGGVAIQAKAVKSYGGNNFSDLRNKYKLLLEEESINFKVRVVYTEIDKPERMQETLKEHPGLKNNIEAIWRRTLPTIPEERSGVYMHYFGKNAKTIGMRQQQLQNDPLGAIAKPTKPLGLEGKWMKIRGNSMYIIKKLPK